MLAFDATLRASPLFAAAASSAAPAPACSLAADGGRLRADYRFADGSRLEARRDPAIEYVSVLLRFAAAQRIDPQAPLAGTERSLFGAAGCGIDWARPDAAGLTTRFDGDSCNCRATVERAPGGGVLSLGLSATC